MRLIYHRAETVRIWLGESYDESKKVFRFIPKLAKVWTSRDFSDSPFATEPCTPKDMESMAALFQRAYWHRVWVVQEIAVARKAVAHCGPDTIIWSELSEALKAVNLMPRQAFGKLPVDSPALLELMICPAMPFTSQLTPPCELEKLLFVHYTKQATNPKDKIFALIGISEARDDPRFVIDYSRSLREIFISVVEYICQVHGHVLLSGSLGI
jgi:hypothetical protein